MKTTMVYRGVNMYSATELMNEWDRCEREPNNPEFWPEARDLAYINTWSCWPHYCDAIPLPGVRFRITHNSTEAGPTWRFISQPDILYYARCCVVPVSRLNESVINEPAIITERRKEYNEILGELCEPIPY